MKQNLRIIGANWKLHPTKLADAEDLFLAVKDAAARARNTSTIIFPPALYLEAVTALYSGTKIGFGAQNIFWEQEGSYTGEISAAQLKDLNVGYTLVGHSERRWLGETNEQTNKKIHAALEQKRSVMLCVGEDERDDDGEYLAALREEVTTGLRDIPKAKLKQIMLAYEPRWAIGGDAETAPSEQMIQEMTIFIRKTLVELFEKQTAMQIPILYGGSVEVENAASIMQEGGVDGLLIGHASREPESFTQIIKAIDKL